MKKINTSFFVALCILLFDSCKVESKKVVVDNSIQQTERKSVKDLAVQKGAKLNPGEALVSVLLKRVESRNEGSVIYAEVIKVEKKSFGFQSILNKGDEIIVHVRKGVTVNAAKQFKCTIEEIEIPNNDLTTFRLNRLL